MKSLLLVISTVILIVSGCDIIGDPIIPFTGNFDVSLYGEPPTFGNAPNSLKNVFIEDFTAHQCGNCPAAAIIAADLIDQYGERVAVAAVHAGSLAEWNEEDPFATNWTNPTSVHYFTQLDFQANPLGRVNRSPDLGNVLSPSEWGSKVEEALLQTPVVNLQMKINYVAENQHLNIHVNGQFPNSYGPQLRLVILITESGMIDYQLDYSSDPPIVPDYEFNHVLRGDVTGPEGLNFSLNASAGAAIQNDYTFDWNPEWIAANSNVVAFVYNSTTGEVMNVIEKHIEE